MYVPGRMYKYMYTYVTYRRTLNHLKDQTKQKLKTKKTKQQIIFILQT